MVSSPSFLQFEKSIDRSFGQWIPRERNPASVTFQQLCKSRSCTAGIWDANIDSPLSEIKKQSLKETRVVLAGLRLRTELHRSTSTASVTIFLCIERSRTRTRSLCSMIL